MTPIQGDWKISGIGLPPEVQRKIYFDNARRLLASSLPLPVMRPRTPRGFFAGRKTGRPRLGQRRARAASNTKATTPCAARPLTRACARCGAMNILYLAYECPFTKLTTFDPA